MKYTTNYNLKKPEATDLVSISDFNENADAVDVEIKALNTTSASLASAITDLSTEQSNFVRKEFKTGSATSYKELSDNNFTDEDKEKLALGGEKEYAYPGGLNQINLNDLTNGYTFDSTGALTENASWSISNKMPIDNNTHYFAQEKSWKNTYLVFFDSNDAVVSAVKYGQLNQGLYGEIPDGATYARCNFPKGDETNVVIFADEAISNDAVYADTAVEKMMHRYVNSEFGDYTIDGNQAYFKDESIALTKLSGSGAKMYNMFSNTPNAETGAVLLPLRKKYFIYNTSSTNITNGTYGLMIVKKNRKEVRAAHTYIESHGVREATVSDEDYNDAVLTYFFAGSLTDEQIAGLMISERGDLKEYHSYGELYYEPDNEMKKLVQASEEEVVKQYDGGVLLGIGDSYMAQGASCLSEIATKHGLACDNRGKASSSISGDEAQTVGLYPFWSRINTAVSEYTAGFTIDETTYKCEDVKLIAFMGGANDGWIDYRRGSGKAETDTNTIYGALNKCFSTLLNSFPNADIIVILQPVNYNYSSAEWTEEQATGYGFENLEAAQSFSDYQLGQYAMHTKETIVKEMAEMYGLPIADCCFEWFSVLNPTDRAKYWSSDKLHLTSEGYNEVYNVSLEKAINNLKITRN